MAAEQAAHAELKVSSFPVLINKVRYYTDNVLFGEWRSPGIKGDAYPTARPTDSFLLDLLLAFVLIYHPFPKCTAGLW